MGTKTILVAFTLGMLFFMSCTSTKNISYFQSAQDTTFRPTLGMIESPIQRNDILNITVTSLSKTASADFNLADPTVKGYLVNSDGNIEMPMLGTVTAAGLTKKQLKENITKAILATKLLKEPIVEIRYINFEVTVLGEVTNPSVISVPSEQISLVKALGLAGDLTIYGKRENVLLIREEDGKRTTRHINLNSVDFLNSPYYYLKPNDVIYVEPSKAKIATTNRSQQIIPIVLSGVSIIALVLDRIIK